MAQLTISYSGDTERRINDALTDVLKIKPTVVETGVDEKDIKPRRATAGDIEAFIKLNLRNIVVQYEHRLAVEAAAAKANKEMDFD